MNITGINGSVANVTDANQLETVGVGQSPMLEASLKGDAFSWTAVTENLAAGGTALCVVNRSQSRRLVIEGLYAWSDVPTALKVHVPAAATWAGTAVVGVNLNRESAALANAVAYANESGTTFADANVILTLQTNELTTDQFGIMVDSLHNGSLILGYNDAVAVDIIADSAAFNCTITGYYID